MGCKTCKIGTEAEDTAFINNCTSVPIQPYTEAYSPTTINKSGSIIWHSLTNLMIISGKIIAMSYTLASIKLKKIQFVAFLLANFIIRKLIYRDFKPCLKSLLFISLKLAILRASTSSLAIF